MLFVTCLFLYLLCVLLFDLGFDLVVYLLEGLILTLLLLFDCVCSGC